MPPLGNWADFPWIVPRSVTHVKHLHSYLAKISSFFFSQSQQTKHSPVDLCWKLAITGKFGKKSMISLKSFFKKCLWKRYLLKKMNSQSHQNHVHSRDCSFSKINRKNILVKLVYNNASYGWPILDQFLTDCFLHNQTIEVEAFFQWWLAFKQHNKKPIKKLILNQLISDKFCSLTLGS